MKRRIKTKHFVYLIIGIVVLWILSWITVDLIYSECSDRGTFGDKFGFVNSLFSGLALAGIIFSIFLQQNELSLQRDELKETRDEFKDQNFQTTFFNLIKTQQNIANEILVNFTHLSSYDKESKLKIEGRKFFIQAKHELNDIIRVIKNTKYYPYESWTFNDEMMNKPQSDWEESNLIFEREAGFVLHNYGIDENEWKKVHELDGIELAKKAYGYFFNRYHFVIGHYFRHLYHIIDFLDSSKKHKLEEEEDKSENDKIISDFFRYSNFIQAQMATPELFLLFYNSLTFPKMQRLLIEYNLLENLSYEDLLDETHNCVPGIKLKSRKQIIE